MNAIVFWSIARRTVALIAFAVAFSLAVPAMAQTQSEDASSAQVAQHRVDINTASFDELVAVPGIGPVLAERIIAARELRPFRVPHELVRVKGIGQGTVQRLLPYVRVERRSR